MTGGCKNGFIVGFLRICGPGLLRRTYRYSRVPRASESDLSDYIMYNNFSLYHFFLLHMITMHFHLHLSEKNILKRIWKSKMNKCTQPEELNGAAKYLQHSDRSLILLLKSRLSEPSSTFPSPLYNFYWFCCHRNHRPPCFSPVSVYFYFFAC
jgi:hypothetical protein